MPAADCNRFPVAGQAGEKSQGCGSAESGRHVRRVMREGWETPACPQAG